MGRRHRWSGTAPLSSSSFLSVSSPAQVESEQEARASGWTPVLRGWKGRIPTSGHWDSPGGSEATQDSGFCSRPSSGSQLGCWLRNLCSEAVSWHGIPRTCQSTKERGHLRGVSSESRSKRGRGWSQWLGRREGWAGAEDLWTRAAEALVPVGRGA